MMEVVKHVVDEYETDGQTFCTVALLYATSPLVDPSDLKNACQQFENGNKDKALLAVTDFPAPIEQAFTLADASDDLMPDDVEGLRKRTQDFKTSLLRCGHVLFLHAGLYPEK